MTDFWKSNPKRQCEFCKCWIADNRASIEFHEKGKNHKENVKRRLAQVKKKAVEKRKADESFGKEFAAMEAAALKAVQKDLMTDPGIVGTSDLKMLVKDSNKTQDISVKADPVNSNTTWIACQAPQGYTYYYNQITGESQWEKPAELIEKVKEERTEIDPKNNQDHSTTQDPYRTDSNCKHLAKKDDSENHPLLGGWTTVDRTSEESLFMVKEEDPQLRTIVKKENEETANKEETPSTNPELHSTESRKRTAIFKEKEVKSLGNTFLEENVGFKKRKIKNNRNARKRDNDVD